MASSDETIQGGNGLMVPDDKSLIIRTIAYFQDVVSKMDLQRLRTDGEAQEALLFCFLLFCFFGWLFYFFLRKAFLSKAGSSSGEAKLSCPTVQMESKKEDHGATGDHMGGKQGGDDTMVPALPAVSQSWKPEVQVQDAESRFANILDYCKNGLSSEEAHALLEALLSICTDTDKEPEDMEPEDTEPEDTEPEDTEPEDTEPEDMEPEDKEPEDMEPEDTEPEDEEPKDKEPEDMEPEDMEPGDEEHRGEQQARERFLKEFPQVKAQLEEKIAKLHALADKVGKVHWDCTITNVVAASTGTVSGILSIIGLALAPVTAGVSLALTATGLGLGAAAGVTGASTAIVEHVTRASAEAEVGRLTSSSVNQVELIKQAVGQSVPRVMNVTHRCIEVLGDVGKNARAIKVAQANPRLLVNANRLMTTGKISARNTRQVQRAFGGTALAMTTGARIAGAASSGLFLLMDVANLVQESVHLHQGASSELAQDLRQRAQELEEKLAQLMEIYRSLQEDMVE